MRTQITSRRLRQNRICLTVDHAPKFVDGDVQVEPVRRHFKLASVQHRTPGAVTLFPAAARSVEPIPF